MSARGPRPSCWRSITSTQLHVENRKAAGQIRSHQEPNELSGQGQQPAQHTAQSSTAVPPSHGHHAPVLPALLRLHHVLRARLAAQAALLQAAGRARRQQLAIPGALSTQRGRRRCLAAHRLLASSRSQHVLQQADATTLLLAGQGGRRLPLGSKQLREGHAAQLRLLSRWLLLCMWLLLLLLQLLHGRQTRKQCAGPPTTRRHAGWRLLLVVLRRLLQLRPML